MGIHLGTDFNAHVMNTSNPWIHGIYLIYIFIVYS